MNKLKAFRKKHGLTQRALAKLVRKSLRQIQYLEKETYQITGSLQMQLEELSKYTPEELKAKMAQAVIVD